MKFYRAREKDINYIKYKDSIEYNTALIASEDNKTIGSLEYRIKNMKEAEIINFNIYGKYDDKLIFRGFVKSIIYWTPYLNRIIYRRDNKFIPTELLIDVGFQKNTLWKLNVKNDIEVFKINIKEITPAQLTINQVKVNKVDRWIKGPEDIVVTCVKIEDKIVCIDGYSRLIVACMRGYKYIFAYLETGSNIEFYKTCIKWCEEQNVFTIKDLTNKLVSSKEHEKLWISRCQNYLNNIKS